MSTQEITIERASRPEELLSAYQEIGTGDKIDIGATLCKIEDINLDSLIDCLMFYPKEMIEHLMKHCSKNEFVYLAERYLNILQGIDYALIWKRDYLKLVIPDGLSFEKRIVVEIHLN